MTLDELEKLCEEATQDPVKATECYSLFGGPIAGRVCEIWDDNGYCSIEDAKFIAACYRGVPKLIAVARAAKNLTSVINKLNCRHAVGSVNGVDAFQVDLLGQLEPALAALESE